MDESSEERQQQEQQQTVMKECMHKTKTIQFLGRPTPIILQNDNGPCPLLAICNVLLLRNNLNLSPDAGEVSQEKLLSLVAERLIDSNSNVNNKDAGYVENQQQNIADAIDLLPRLATGIDVNIKFRRIDDFEFTPECAIFDLLDIPLYHGWIVHPQDCILDSGTAVFEDREPVYEGEGILTEQADKSTSDACNVRSKDEITQQQGELIKSFLKNNASQLTFYGLFCLQDGLKERELCVFFRNNHFSTMLKYDGELYLLATDQGYINQPDLVWEKLNEVNGDTLFMTSNFKEFKVESHENDSWDEHGAVSSTTDYLAHYDTTAHWGSDMNSDLQLAIALQQQEFEQQPQRPNLQLQQPPVTGSSKLITGPQDILMAISKTEINLRRLLAAAPQQQNQAKLIHYVATLREQLEQLAEERTPEGLPRVSKAQVNDYSEKIDAIAAKLVTPLPPIRVSEDPLKSNSFKVSTSKTDGETHAPTSPGLRRRFMPASDIEERARGTFEVDTSEPVKLDAQAHVHIEKHRKLQENLTDEMVGLARQLKESSLLISQSVQNTEKVLDSTEKAIEQSLASTGHANVRAMKIYSESSKTTCFTWLLMFAMTCIFIMVVLLIRVT